MRVLIRLTAPDGLLYLKRDEFKRLLNKSVDEIRDFYLPFV